MKRRLERGLLKHLASLSVALGTGLAEPAVTLAQVPQELLEDAADEVDEPDWQVEDRKRLFLLLVRDSRPGIRLRVAELADSLWPTEAETALDLLRRLANDEDPDVREAVAIGVERALRRAAPLERIGLVGAWATSESVGERAAIAGALRGSVPVLVADVAIEQLAADPSPEVRRCALAAAAGHFDEAPTAYRRIIARLAADTERPIRQRALRILERETGT